MLVKHPWRGSLLALIMLVSVLTAGAAVTLTRDGDRYVLENAVVRLRVNPTKGGLVDSYIVKVTGHELIGENGFLLGDHFWQQNWPGEFLAASYTATIISNTPAEATLEVARVSTGWLGKKAQNDLRVARRLTLRDDSPVLQVEIAVENVGQTGRLAGYWSQHVFYADGRKEETQRYFRPSVRAVSEVTYQSHGDIRTGDQYGDNRGFVRDPQQGWTAVLGAESGNGLAFVMRYDELMFLYNCLGQFTTEWQYTNAAIPAGKTWRTDYLVYPLAGMPRVDYASHHCVVAIEPSDADGMLTVRLSLAAAGAPLHDVQVEGSVVMARKEGHPGTALPPQTLARVTTTPSACTLQLPHDPFEPLALHFTVRGMQDGEAFSETFDTWYGAKYGMNHQVDGSPLYVLPAPERHVTFLKPEHMEKIHNTTPHVLFCKGVFADDYLPPALFPALRAEVTNSYFTSANVFPASISEFPGSYEDLMGVDIIALINIDAAALGSVGQQMLQDFVTHGGTLLYGGDLWAYQQGNLSDGPLNTLLPVTFLDKKTSGAPQWLHESPVKLCDGDGHPQRPLAKGAVLLYRTNTFVPKTGAHILVSTTAGPIVVSWNVGEGRVIALTGAALGEASAKNKLYTRTPEWTAWLTKLLTTR